MELEEERTLHRQRNQHIKEQQIRIDNLSNIVHFSDSDQKSHTQVCFEKLELSVHLHIYGP